MLLIDLHLWCSSIYEMLVTARQRSCGKVMFLHPCIILLRGQTPHHPHPLLPPPRGRSIPLRLPLPLSLPLWRETPWYWHIVTATEVGGTHSTRMNSCLNYAFLHQIPKYQRSSVWDCFTNKPHFHLSAVKAKKTEKSET